MKMSIHSATAQNGFLRRTFCFALAAAVLLASTHRLPAPIQEIPESPTPASQESSSPQQSKHSAKSKPDAEENKAPSNRHKSASTTRTEPQTPANQSRFAGVWTGRISLGILGTTDETLTINSTGTMVGEKNRFGTATHPATWDGTTVKFQAGALNEIAFTLTPSADGQTAVVTANSLFISNPGAAFRRESSSEAAAASATTPPQAEIPTAKPVPERPGYVYNPFNPAATRLLDVRGKPSGTKLKDPSTGKTFIVP